MNVIRVGIADYAVSRAPFQLTTVGLGSCVGVALYDEKTKVGGLGHILLPDSGSFLTVNKREKFADLALPMMVKELEKLSMIESLKAKIVGGASMFSHETNPVEGIGQKNVRAVEEVLKQMGIPIIGAHVGGNQGRSMLVDLENFMVKVSMGSKEIIIL